MRDGRGKHRFRAGAPNELWITDVTEFRIPAGKTCLSPMIDCFDGMPISWTISTSPDAEMANSSLLGACSRLKAGEHPKGHSDSKNVASRFCGNRNGAVSCSRDRVAAS